MRSLQRFLNLAKMTADGAWANGYWGLTQITAHDEMTLLKLLTSNNTVLNAASRSVRPRPDGPRHRVAAVGSPGGHTRRYHGPREERLAPAPDPRLAHSQHRQFHGRGRYYLIAVLTQDNPTMAYGVRTIENVAEVIHRDLNAGACRGDPGLPLLAVVADAR